MCWPLIRPQSLQGAELSEQVQVGASRRSGEGVGAPWVSGSGRGQVWEWPAKGGHGGYGFLMMGLTGMWVLGRRRDSQWAQDGHPGVS